MLLVGAQQIVIRLHMLKLYPRFVQKSCDAVLANKTLNQYSNKTIFGSDMSFTCACQKQRPESLFKNKTVGSYGGREKFQDCDYYCL